MGGRSQEEVSQKGTRSLLLTYTFFLRWACVRILEVSRWGVGGPKKYGSLSGSIPEPNRFIALRKR